LSGIACDLDGLAALAASFDKLHQEWIGEAGWIANAGHLSPHPDMIIESLPQGKS
jgi:hypothetical protein